MKVKKMIAQVSEEEKKVIQTLHERKAGLMELSKILTADKTDLYEKLVKDMGETQVRFQTWWDEMSTKNNWESHPDGNWEIDFQTNEIFLVVNKK